MSYLSAPALSVRSMVRGLVAGLLCGTLWLPAANAQVNRGGREYPSDVYYLGIRLMDAGEFVSASEAFQRGTRTGIQRAEGPWVDSICHLVMWGECYYQMGDLGRALEKYTAALQLYISSPSWLLSVDFAPAIEPRTTPLRTPITWGNSQRQTLAGRFTNRYSILQGTLNINQVLQQGGPLSSPEFIIVNAHEVMRCTARAIRRRAEIMGAACEHDPLTAQLVQTFAARPAPVNHWSQSWIECLLGLSYLSSNRPNEAATELTRSLQIGGQFDHPLTGEALLALGKMAFGQQQYDAAATFFQEATFSAAWFDHIDVMAEAFQWGTQTHLVGRMPGGYGPLEAAVAWARRQRAPVLEATLIVCQAQQAAESNDAVLAASLADRARRAMTRTEMSKGAVGARLSYVMALTAFLSGNLAAGEAAWADVLAYQTSANRMGSHRLFEIGLVDGMVSSGRVTARVANELFARVLREPTPIDWTTAPVETMATVLFAPESVFERWLNIALEREEIERAAEIADRIRRLRFYATLPMGGRVLALGWTLAAPQESLSDSTLLIRQDLLTRYPKIADILRRSDALRDALRSAPLGPAGAVDGAAAKPAKGWGELAALGQAQELLLRELALRREPADFVFPPPLDCKKLQERLPPRQAILSFLLTSQNQLHGFLHSRSGSRHWIIDGVPQVGKAVADLLRQFGQFDRNTPVDLDVLASDDWHATAAAIWQHLISGAQFDSAGEVEELVIVPDRFLWYLPFEALPASDEEAAPPLLSLVRVRYVPTVALAVPDQRPFSLAKSTVVVTGKMFTNDDMADATSAAEQLRKVLGEVTELKSLPAPGALLSVMGQRTLVLHDAGDSGRTAYDWAPLQLDHDKPGNSLAGWMAMPWGAPEQLIIPAFHSGAESAAALRRGMNGDEIFLSACGLMAAGSRTVLLSRWRTGGRTAFDLTREFTQELPFVSAPNAWQRSVQLLWEKELQLDREPRVKAGNVDSSIKATHPFFWAGYVLVDSGVRPLSAESEAAAKEAVGKEAVGKEAVGKEAAGKEAAGKEAAGKEAVGKEAVGKEAVGKEAVGKEAVGKEAVGKEAAGKEAAGKEAVESKRSGA